MEAKIEREMKLKSQSSSLADEEARKRQLREEMRLRLKGVENEARIRVEKQEKKLKSGNQKEVTTIQRNEEKIHDKAVDALKIRFADKLEFDQSRIQMESAQLIEESGDIDSQIAFLKFELDGKYKQDETAATNALKDAIEQIKQDNERRL